MAGILGIIQQYKGQLILFPIVTVLLIAITLILFLLAYQYSKLKYFPGVIAIVAGAVITFFSIKVISGKSGLDMLWLGLSLFIGGWIALGTAWILALLDSLQKGRKSAKDSFVVQEPPETEEETKKSPRPDEDLTKRFDQPDQ